MWRASASAVVSSIALRRAEDKVRHPAARIQVELDRPGSRIESGLALRNQRKILHVQLSLQHAYDLIWAEKVPGGHDPVAKLIFARVPGEHGWTGMGRGFRRPHQMLRIPLVFVAHVLQHVR